MSVSDVVALEVEVGDTELDGQPGLGDPVAASVRCVDTHLVHGDPVLEVLAI
jgi:hypothetical protein